MSANSHTVLLNGLLSVLVCAMVSMVANAQQISNLTVIQTDLENYENNISANYMVYEESENYNYLALEFGNLPLEINGELVAEGGEKFVDSRQNFYYLIQMDKNNQFEAYTNVYVRGIDDGINKNVADFDGSIGMTSKDGLVYIYGSSRLTDSLFVKDEFITSLPKNGSFILTFNENLDLIGEFFYGLDEDGVYGDVNLKVDSEGDLHIAGRFFTKKDSDFNLEIGNQIIEPIHREYETQTFYYVVVDPATNEIKVQHSFGGIFNNFARLHGFQINDKGEAFILFDQADELMLDGELLENEPHFYDVTLLVFNFENLKYFVNYEGPDLQSGHFVEKLSNNHTCEYIRTKGGSFPLIVNGESIFYDAEYNHLIINRNPDGEISWIQNIEGETGGGSEIFDVTLSGDQSTLWVSGTLKPGESFLVDNNELSVEESFGGFLMGLDANTGAFKNVFYPTMQSDPGKSPFTYISNVQGIENQNIKVVSQIGRKENTLEDSYEYTIGNLTIPMAGKGELVIYDLDPEFMVSSIEHAIAERQVVPNPIMPGQSVRFSDPEVEFYLLYDTAGKEIGKLKNGVEFPLIEQGYYWLKPSDGKELQKIIVLR